MKRRGCREEEEGDKAHGWKLWQQQGLIGIRPEIIREQPSIQGKGGVLTF